MSQLGLPFFSLTTTNKRELVEDQLIDISLVYNMSYWDAKLLPVPVRHYMIQRYNKHQEPKESKGKEQPFGAKSRLPSTYQKNKES